MIRRETPVVAAVFVLFGLVLAEGYATSNGGSRQAYQWEWPADRTPETRVLAKVSKVEKQKVSSSGLNKPPSIAGNLPDPFVLTGTIIDGDEKLINQTFTLTLPKVEASSIAANDIVALGLLNRNTCICIAKVPGNESRANQLEWLANWKCEES